MAEKYHAFPEYALGQKFTVLAEVILSCVHKHENSHNNLEFEYELRATDKDQ